MSNKINSYQVSNGKVQRIEIDTDSTITSTTKVSLSFSDGVEGSFELVPNTALDLPPGLVYVSNHSGMSTKVTTVPSLKGGNVIPPDGNYSVTSFEIVQPEFLILYTMNNAPFKVITTPEITLPYTVVFSSDSSSLEFNNDQTFNFYGLEDITITATLTNSDGSIVTSTKKLVLGDSNDHLFSASIKGYDHIEYLPYYLDDNNIFEVQYNPVGIEKHITLIPPTSSDYMVVVTEELSNKEIHVIPTSIGVNKNLKLDIPIYMKDNPTLTFSTLRMGGITTMKNGLVPDSLTGATKAYQPNLILAGTKNNAPPVPVVTPEGATGYYLTYSTGDLNGQRWPVDYYTGNYEATDLNRYDTTARIIATMHKLDGTISSVEMRSVYFGWYYANPEQLDYQVVLSHGYANLYMPVAFYSKAMYAYNPSALWNTEIEYTDVSWTPDVVGSPMPVLPTRLSLDDRSPTGQFLNFDLSSAGVLKFKFNIKMYGQLAKISVTQQEITITIS